MSSNHTWLRAFRQGNSKMAKAVASYMEYAFDWEPLYSDHFRCIESIDTGNGTWAEDLSTIDDMDDDELLESIADGIGMGRRHIEMLDKKFNKKIDSIGKYTKLPLPKEVKTEVSNGSTI